MTAIRLAATERAASRVVAADLRLVLPYALLILAAATVLPLPFTGDQALIAYGSEAISKGALLYRDFWDLKLPGTYGFYLVAGSLFGFSEVGLHTAELLYLSAFGSVLFMTVRQWVANATVARAAPLVVLGVYLVGVRPYELGQMEALVGFPLYLALVSAHRIGTAPHRLRWWIALGMATAVVALFKHLYALIAVAFLLRTLWHLARQRSAPITVMRGMGWVVVGGALLILPIAAFFASQGQVERIIWTYFGYATSIATEARPLYRLISTFGHQAALTAPLLVLAAAALLGGRGRSWGRLRGDLILWIALGFSLAMLQSWWAYQFLVLYVPLALLAVLGLDALASGAVPHARAWVAATALASLSLAVMFTGRVAVEARHGFGLTEEQRAGIHQELVTEYGIAAEEMRVLNGPDAIPGDIYVVGNPILLLQSGRSQAIPINGWSPELHDQRAWDEVAGSLRSAKPPYIFVDARYVPRIPEWSEALVGLLSQDYDLYQAGSNGNWYRLKQGVPGATQAVADIDDPSPHGARS